MMIGLTQGKFNGCAAFITLALLVCLVFGVPNVGGQNKKTARPEPTPPASQPANSDAPARGAKKNGRPEKGAIAIAVPWDNYTPTYFYEFTRPGFIVSHILIEHDEKGRGKISFLKTDLTEMITDPLQLSGVTQRGIDETLERLDFLNSSEDYQYEKDLSNMGNIVFRYVRAGRERTVKFNWTTQMDAKFLMDEYRRIGIEAVWKFDMAGARLNQPLTSPRLLDELDGYLARGEISDPPNILPYLKELKNDERLPLIARNHAERLTRRIEKAGK